MTVNVHIVVCISYYRNGYVYIIEAIFTKSLVDKYLNVVSFKPCPIFKMLCL
jgi:hypothetical protein